MRNQPMIFSVCSGQGVSRNIGCVSVEMTKGNDKRSCYEVNCGGEEQENRIWKTLRSARIHNRFKVFLWRALADVLPTKGRLASILEIKDQSCSICGDTVEDSLHLFKYCNGIRALAFASGRGRKIDA